jgi:hypothetical protein
MFLCIQSQTVLILITNIPPSVFVRINVSSLNFGIHPLLRKMVGENLTYQHTCNYVYVLECNL